MQWLVEERYPKAEVIRVMLDQLNTHKVASLYAAFARSAERGASPGSWRFAIRPSTPAG
jgi:hypothetical protein